MSFITPLFLYKLGSCILSLVVDELPPHLFVFPKLLHHSRSHRIAFKHASHKIRPPKEMHPPVTAMLDATKHQLTKHVCMLILNLKK